MENLVYLFFGCIFVDTSINIIQKPNEETNNQR